MCPLGWPLDTIYWLWLLEYIFHPRVLSQKLQPPVVVPEDTPGQPGTTQKVISNDQPTFIDLFRHPVLRRYTISVCFTTWVDSWRSGRFKNIDERLNLRALKFSPVNRICVFQCMGKIFYVEFQSYPLKFHTKYHIHTLKDMIFYTTLKF